MITSYCALHRKECRFYVSIKGGKGGVGGVTRRVLCTWQLLGLGVKGPWLALGRPIVTLAA